MTEWYVLEVGFIDLHLFAPASAPPSAAGLSAPAGRSAVVRVAGPAEKLDIIRHDVDLATLGAVLGLPGTVLQTPFDEDGVALLLVVGDRLAELASGGDVEEVVHARVHNFCLLASMATGLSLISEKRPTRW